MIFEQQPRMRAIVRAACVATLTLALAACNALPRSGPLASDIDSGETEEAPEGLVAPLTPDVAAFVNRAPERGYPQAFLTASAVDPERLGVGDSLDILVWEPGGSSLFGAGSDGDAGAVALPDVRIDARGRIFVPFVGDIQAAGLTPAELRERLRTGLSAFADRPAVDIRVSDARSRMVTVQGAVGRSGVYMLDRGFTSLTPLLALAGGPGASPAQTEVSVRRGQAMGAEMLEDIYANPALDIALRPNDVIVLKPIQERFIALGASSAQAEVVFPTRRLNLLSALGAVAGLRDFDADPAGVFVLRFEDPGRADALLEGPVPPGLPTDQGRPIVYRVDLTTPEGLFAARTFLMRDGDAVFAANAPLTELRKFIQIFTSVLTPVQQSVGIATVAP
jgi:polysaccharide export outer membrane protein